MRFTKARSMKKLSYIFLFLTGSFYSYSQNRTDSIPPLFRGEINGDLIREHYTYSSHRFPAVKDLKTGKAVTGSILIAIFFSNKLKITKQLPHEKFPEIKNFYKDRPSKMEIPEGGYPGETPIPIFDSAGIAVTVNGINSRNAAQFEFRVLENKTKEVIPWRNINLYSQPYMMTYDADGSETTEIAYLGLFTTDFGNSLTIEVRQKDNKVIVGHISAIWIKRAPSVLGTFTAGDMPAFLNVFKKQWQHDILIEQTSEERMSKDSFLIYKKNFASSENSIIFYLDDKVKSKDVIEYNLIARGKSSGWKQNDFDLNLIWLKNLSPGKYTLQMRYSIQRSVISEYPFTIRAAWYQTLVFKIILILVIASIPVLIFLLFKLRRQRQKLLMEEMQKRIKQTELKAIRAQLNPHFIFNSLSSIQSLITMNDPDRANQYLTEFSSLMRESLTENDNDFTSLSAEIKMLDSYLKLEQLRFGFKYVITIDNTINKDAAEVPAILLQPPVENAIKHGVSSLYEKGEINIDFKRSGADMIVTITDNGAGFITTEPSKGFGLKLTKERISLVNSLLKDQSISIDIKSSTSGTTVYLNFKNWLA
jgi:two-component sensor histidine kinase